MAAKTATMRADDPASAVAPDVEAAFDPAEATTLAAVDVFEAAAPRVATLADVDVELLELDEDD